jgi:hypothetical protein
VAAVNGDDDDDDEFFDADSDSDAADDEDAAPAAASAAAPTAAPTPDAVDAAMAAPVPAGSVGALRPLVGRRLLKTGVQMFEPVTQAAGPVTEDMLQQQQTIMATLGDTLEASAVRQRLQSALLVSDMRAFKAANPDAVLADFVRWWSPKDWEQETAEGYDDDDTIPGDWGDDDGEDADDDDESCRVVWPGHGRLSKRMRGSSNGGSVTNPWVSAWKNVGKGQAAEQQRPLFDASSEAEKVLHHMETIAPSQLLAQLLPCALAAALSILSHASRGMVGKGGGAGKAGSVGSGAQDEEGLPTVATAMAELKDRSQHAVQLLQDATRAQQEEAIALRTRSGRSSPKNTTAVGGEVAGGEVSEAKRTLDQAWLALNVACDAAKKAEVVCAMAASLLNLFPGQYRYCIHYARVWHPCAAYALYAYTDLSMNHAYTTLRITMPAQRIIIIPALLLTHTPLLLPQASGGIAFRRRGESWRGALSRTDGGAIFHCTPAPPQPVSR